MISQKLKRLFVLFFAAAGLLSCSVTDNPKNGNQTKQIVYVPNDSLLNQFPPFVHDLLTNMTLEEKIGQMIQVNKGNLIDPGHITSYNIGSLLSGGGVVPSPNTPQSWVNMISNYQTYALKTRLKIPLIYGIDAVHGHNNALNAVIFPHNIGIGATRDTNIAMQAARITALEMIGTGIRWTFAPCITVPQNESWGRTYEGFGEDPQLVSDMGSAEILGFQGTNLSDQTSVLATAKHFAGDGGTANGTDRGDTIGDDAQLRATHLFPYLSAVSNGVGSVMVSYSQWNGVMMHENGELISNVLKRQLGFKGLVVSDWDAINYLSGTFDEKVAKSVNAGVDMIMMAGISYQNFVISMKSLVAVGTVSWDRLDEAAGRILTVKYNMGLFDHPFADSSYTADVGSAAHRSVARTAVKKSIVLLTNMGGLLPLSTNISKIYVAGSNADDIGAQCGGWTLTWQGQNGNITAGTTILQGIKNAVSAGTTVVYDATGIDTASAASASVAIVVIGETKPYAEGMGDRGDLTMDSAQQDMINNIRNTGVPIAVVIISGRPLILPNSWTNWNALVEAWYPGTEGDGVADVLFGKYAPTGKLPCTWPASMSQIPINKGDGKTGLFPYGYGLTY